MRNRRVSMQAFVWPGHVIILFDEFFKQPFKMALVMVFIPPG